MLYKEFIKRMGWSRRLFIDVILRSPPEVDDEGSLGFFSTCGGSE